MQNHLTKDQILKATGIKYYTLDYLYKSGQIKAKTYGKGTKRRYYPDTIEKIEEWKKKKGNK